MRYLVFLLTLLTSFASGATAPLCENIFAGNRGESEFSHYRQVLALEDFKPRETRLALELILRTGAGTETFLYRYKDLELLTTNEVAVGATPEMLLKLTAVSLQKRFDVPRVKTYLGSVLLQTRGYIEGTRAQRQAIPHRIHLALTELAISSGKSPGEVAITYSEHLKEILTRPPSLEEPTALPVDQALNATRAEISPEGR